jgi:hypothetical protein
MIVRRPSWRFLLLLTGVLFLAQALPLPGPVRDAADFSWPPGFHWQWPLLHLIFTPFCSLADYLTVLSLKEHIVLQLWVLLLLPLWAKVGMRGSSLTSNLSPHPNPLPQGERDKCSWKLFFCRLLLFWLAWLLFLAWGAVVPHPMARLVTDNPRTLLIDFHSHTQYSHDGRPSFSPFANMQWHQKQGYNAAFITDHNRNEAAALAHEQSKKDWRDTGYYSLMGEEVSLQKTHLVLLGNHTPVDNRPYDSDFNRVPLFLHDMHAQRWLVIASLPEYWLYHWGDGVQKMVAWGMDGFEIVNSAPKGLDFPLSLRRFIVELCRTQNLPMTGISDNHGYGYATAAWNAMSISGWRRLDPDQLELVILLLLKKKGFSAVQVLERPKFWPETKVELVFSPLMNAVIYLRSLAPIQRAAWAAWLWGPWFLFGKRNIYG